MTIPSLRSAIQWYWRFCFSPAVELQAEPARPSQGHLTEPVIVTPTVPPPPSHSHANSTFHICLEIPRPPHHLPMRPRHGGKRVAIVGSGVSGIGALYALRNTHHDVHLFEAADRLGGHTNTCTWTSPGGKECPVDTGFIVLNTATYRTSLFLPFLGGRVLLDETRY